MENENKTNEETKQVSNEQNNTQNINYNTKSVKKSNAPVLICLIIVILALIGIIVCLVIMNLQNNKVNNVAIDSKNQTEQNTNKDVTNNTNNSTQNVEQKTTEQKIADAYKKWEGMSWISQRVVDKTNGRNGFIVENNELICIYANLGKVPFTYGTPLYAYGLFNGGMVLGGIVVTKEGKAYIYASDWYGFNKLEDIIFKEIKINGKVIDMTLGPDYAIPSIYPYFLTEDGNLYNKDGKTFEEVNGNHIIRYGDYHNIGYFYINKDNTLEYELSKEDVQIYTDYQEGKVLIKDTNGNNIKVKSIFATENYINNYYFVYKFYVLDTDNKLLEFSSETKFIAKESDLSIGKKVASISYTYDQNTRIYENKNYNKAYVTFEDGTKITIDRLLSNSKE